MDPQGRVTVVALNVAPDGSDTVVQVVQLSSSGMPGPIHTFEEVPHDPNGQCICPELAVDPSGRAVVTWQTVSEEDHRIAAAWISAEGVPHTPILLSPEGEDAARPSVAAGGGSFAVVWHVGAEARVEAALIDSDGNAGEARQISKPGEKANFPRVAGGPEGVFHVAWSDDENGVSTTALDEEGGPVSIERVSPAGEQANPSGIVVDSKGRTTIAWGRESGLWETKAVRLGADGTPGTVWTLQPPDQNVVGAKIAVDGQDRVTAVWEDFKERVSAVRLDADGIPEAVHQLSPEGHHAGGPQVAAAPDGRVAVVWNHPGRFFIPEESCGVTHLEPEDDVVRVALIGADGQLAEVHDVSAYGEEAAGAKVALDPLGLPWVVWETYDGTYFCEEATGRVLIGHGFEPQVPPVEMPAALPPAAETLPAPAQLRLARRGIARDGRIRIKASCSAASGRACSGAIRLIAPALAFSAKGALLRPGRGATLALARGQYRIEPGQTAMLELSIPSSTKRLISAKDPERIPARVQGRGLPARTVLIRVVGTSQ